MIAETGLDVIRFPFAPTLCRSRPSRLAADLLHPAGTTSVANDAVPIPKPVADKQPTGEITGVQ